MPHWFEDLASHMGPAYLRYSFTMGTDQEVKFLVQQLGLEPGMAVLDVGCGPGRHVLALARLGIAATGVDISERFIDTGRELAEREGLDGATFVRGDARELGFDAEFDAAISLCQGAFGLSGPNVGPDDPFNLAADSAVLAGIRRAIVPGGRVALSAFSSYFQVQYLEDHDRFDAATAINHEPTEVRNAEGTALTADLWTTCYTPRELALIVERAGLVVDDICAVTPGDYAVRAADIGHPEFLVLAKRPVAP